MIKHLILKVKKRKCKELLESSLICFCKYFHKKLCKIERRKLPFDKFPNSKATNLNFNQSRYAADLNFKQ